MSGIVVVVGPTAAGKTDLGAALAERLGGEVVSADAFAVYRGMDIGTAKPDAEVRRRIRHHLIDVADPRERYSAGRFVGDADRAIAEISERGRTPVVVGGTLFYVRALLRGLFPEPPRDPELRRRLEADWDRDPDALRERLATVDPAAAERIAPRDRQRTIRALEVGITAGRPMTELWRDHPVGRPRYRFCLLATSPPRDELRARIDKRVERMFTAGLVEEVRGLLAAGVSPLTHALKAIGYRECCGVVIGKRTEAEARNATVLATRQLARRQRTWLRGEEGVVWLSQWGASALGEALERLEAIGGPRAGAVEKRS